MRLDPAAVLDVLLSRPPTALGSLPRSHGIYTLRDHEGLPRYIGITGRERLGFYGRINCRHAAGSEGRSHKFAHAYNVGRMWRRPKDGASDAVTAKRLRTAFARRYCGATFLELPPSLLSELPALERAVQQLASTEMLAWGDKRDFTATAEPVVMVDALLDEMGEREAVRGALRRQADRYEQMLMMGREA